MRDFCHVCGGWYVERYINEVRGIKKVDCRCGAIRIVYIEDGECTVNRYSRVDGWVRLKGEMLVDGGVEV